MKRLVLFIAMFMLLGSVAIADPSDITTGVAEVRPDVAKWRMKGVLFLLPTETCKVMYTKLDAADVPTGQLRTVVFQNIPDDPDTPEDETVTEFAQLIALINNNSNIKTSITQAVKVKLGL